MEEPKLTKKQEEALALLDRNLQLTREFMNDWLLFNQIITAYGAPGANKAELEAQFLKVKCKMARQHQVLKSALGADGKIDGNTMNIISTTTNLESIHAGSDIVIKKLGKRVAQNLHLAQSDPWRPRGQAREGHVRRECLRRHERP